MRDVSKERRRRRMTLEGGTGQGEKLIVGPRNQGLGDNKIGQNELKKIGQIAPSFRESGRTTDSSVNTNNVTDTNEFETNEVIPISTCFWVFFCYILLGSILFSWWEGWEYFEGSYFCFVSLVTIGFSDMVPGQSRITGSAISGSSKTNSVSISGDGKGGNRATGESTAYGSNGREESLDHVDGQLILCSIYILFGMALMAMCFHLTQERFFTSAKKLGRTLHLI